MVTPDFRSLLMWTSSEKQTKTRVQPIIYFRMNKNWTKHSIFSIFPLSNIFIWSFENCLQRFWKVKNFSTNKQWTTVKKMCTDYLRLTTWRNLEEIQSKTGNEEKIMNLKIRSSTYDKGSKIFSTNFNDNLFLYNE